jgi:hypothetical protein
VDDPRLAEYRMLWTEPGWSLWRTPGGRLIPINPQGQIGVDLRGFDDGPTFAAVVVERMVAAGVAVSDERPETVRDLPTPPHGEYLMWPLEAATVMDGWDEWANWVVLDPVGLPVGTIAESHELVAHNTWGPATYTASHNPAGHDGRPLWHQTGYPSPEEAYAALLAVLRPEEGDGRG